jgi:hypothetical protein
MRFPPVVIHLNACRIEGNPSPFPTTWQSADQTNFWGIKTGILSNKNKLLICDNWSRREFFSHRKMKEWRPFGALEWRPLDALLYPRKAGGEPYCSFRALRL